MRRGREGGKEEEEGGKERGRAGSVYRGLLQRAGGEEGKETDVEEENEEEGGEPSC